MKSLIVLTMLLVLPMLVGCRSQQEKAKADWVAFVDNVKANIPAAQEAARTFWADHAPEHTPQIRVEVAYLHDDIKQSDSLKFPYVGDITMEWKMFLGGKAYSNMASEHNYKFGWISGRWKYIEMTHKCTKDDDPSEVGKTGVSSTPITEPPDSVLFKSAL
jgi:hypothetical protein